MAKEMHLQENTLFDLWPKGLGGQGHTKCCPVPSTTCDLCTSKVRSLMLHPTVKEKIYLQENTLFDRKCYPEYHLHSVTYASTKAWSCYVKRFRRRCIYKKIHYLTLRAYDMLPSTLYIMWPRPVGSNYRLGGGGGGGTHKKQLQIGGAHINFFKMTDHFFNFFFFGGGGDYLGGTTPPPPIPTGLWPIQLQSLKLVLLMVKEEILLQEMWRPDEGPTLVKKLIYPSFLKKKAGKKTFYVMILQK